MDTALPLSASKCHDCIAIQIRRTVSIKQISVVGFDLAKDVFQVFGIDDCGHQVASRKLRRKQVVPYFAQLNTCLVGMEACSNSHYWARELTALGHQVRVINPRYVKPFLKGNKNDYNDAEAISEAVQRPTMRFVEVKTPEQQAVLHLHQSRSLLLRERIAKSNHLRALLSEYGIVIPQGVNAFEREAPIILADEEMGLPALARRVMLKVWEAYRFQQSQLQELDQELACWHRGNEASCRLAEIPGIGVQTATALVAKLGDGRSFSNGREVSAYLGLVPRQASSGGKDRMLGISKRGDGYLRCLLVQGAKSVIRHVRRRQRAGLPGGNPWVEALLQRLHPNKAAIALANKMARVAWVVLAREEHYCRAVS